MPVNMTRVIGSALVLRTIDILHYINNDMKRSYVKMFYNDKYVKGKDKKLGNSTSVSGGTL